MLCPTLPACVIKGAQGLSEPATVYMVGPGDIDLMHAATLLPQAMRVVETCVA